MKYRVGDKFIFSGNDNYHVIVRIENNFYVMQDDCRESNDLLDERIKNGVEYESIKKETFNKELKKILNEI